MASTFLVLGAKLSSGGIISWLIIGLVAGFLASQIMRGSGFGVIGDIIVGLIGAFIGGLIANFLLPGQNFGFLGSLIVSIIGAVVLLAILHAVSGRSRTL